MTLIQIRKTEQCTFFLQLNDFDKYLKNYIPIGFPLLFICHDLPKKFLGLYKCLIIAIEKHDFIFPNKTMSTVSNHNNAWHEIKTNKYWHALQCTHFENSPLGLFMVIIIVIIV